MRSTGVVWWFLPLGMRRGSPRRIWWCCRATGPTTCCCSASATRSRCRCWTSPTAGSPRTALAPAADLRTDLPRYRVWRDRELVDEPSDVTDLWRDDLVSFLIGCSFSFEQALIEAGVPVRNIEQDRNVSMYKTNRDCRPAGRLAGPLVVSMRPIPAALVATAVQVTARMPQVHGAPVHIGSSESLGVRDVGQPDFGDPVEFEPGDVPVYWACGVTPQAALMDSRPPFAITHAPGHMFVTDVPDSAYRQP